MKINQLFVSIVDDETLNDLLECIPLHGLDDKNAFSKDDIVANGSIQVFNDNVLEKLRHYYLPCKANMYLFNISVMGFITIIKQVLRLFNYKLVSIKKNSGKKKIIYYKIHQNIIDAETIVPIENKQLISFK